MRYRFIGDTLLTVPFLRNLRAAYPDARIDMLVAPGSGEILTHCPYVDELIQFDTTRKHRYENQSQGKARTFWSYVGELKRRRYDTAFVLKRSLSSAALAFLAGIPERIGFDTEHRRLLLTKAIPYPQERHEVECFLDVLRAADIPVRDTHLQAWWGEEDEARMTHRLQPFAQAQNVLIHLTSSNPAKQLPNDQALALMSRLLADETVHLHALGAAADKALYEALAAQLPETARARLHNWCGDTSLLESLAFLKRMDRVIGVDSGTLHMAAAVGTPVTALFGPMDERKWRPWQPDATVITANVPCRPCNLKTPCHDDFQCMTRLPLQEIALPCKTP